MIGFLTRNQDSSLEDLIGFWASEFGRDDLQSFVRNSVFVFSKHGTGELEKGN